MFGSAGGERGHSVAMLERSMPNSTSCIAFRGGLSGCNWAAAILQVTRHARKSEYVICFNESILISRIQWQQCQLSRIESIQASPCSVARGGHQRGLLKTPSES